MVLMLAHGQELSQNYVMLSPLARLFNLQSGEKGKKNKKNPAHLFSSLQLHLCGLRHDNIKCDFRAT